ncbi:MAG: DnaJ C-terminal domain-containing protein [Planctomycetota bacterium]|jgi:DnaJ-class molecular chaperone
MADDYYSVLGVQKGASADEIRKAYRRLSRENHPDVKPDDKAAADKFKQVQEAYSVLSDDEKRQKYDRFGHAAFQGAGGGQAWTGSGPIDLGDLFGGGGAGVDLGDLFGGAFGSGAFGGAHTQRRGPAGPRKGQDAETSIDIPFTTAAEGGTYDLTVSLGGTSERLTVRIPAGIESGRSIRLSGQGHPGMHGGPNGDLLVKVRVAAHPWFRREGSSLFVDVPITLTEAALGAKVDVPTLSEGRVSVTVPAGTSSGAKLRLREKGVVDPKSKQRGDLFAVLKIVVPKELDEESRRLLEEFSERNPTDPRARLW